MTTQVKAWGNSQGIRLPKEVLDLVGIHKNDYLEITIVDGNILLSPCFRHKTLEERAALYGGKLGPYSEVDLGDPEGRERW
ncbi:MAG: AbrB/MazE/SpoVT family DNA-binding domain-containing protein [Lachnospiraceae bacterium]|nr:AbrB/MazE/SpoVT family DNA-binding domain-containing protein [Lachnospiraceae bacterium]